MGPWATGAWLAAGGEVGTAYADAYPTAGVCGDVGCAAGSDDDTLPLEARAADPFASVG